MKKDELKSNTDNLTWRQDRTGWRLFAGRRCYGRVVPDTQHPKMWRSELSCGRLSDMANLSWAKNAVLEAAIREIEWEELAAGRRHHGICK
jgi:hypothetical protein